MRISRARRRASSLGFATTEILVAVAVVVLVGTLGFLTFGNRDAAQVRGEAAQVALLLHQGRLMAAESGRPVDVTFDPRAGVLAAGSMQHRLGRGIVAEVVPARVRVQPSGESDGMLAVLEKDGQRASVRLDWLTGRVEVTQ